MSDIIFDRLTETYDQTPETPEMLTFMDIRSNRYQNIFRIVLSSF